MRAGRSVSLTTKSTGVALVEGVQSCSTVFESCHPQRLLTFGSRSSEPYVGHRQPRGLDFDSTLFWCWKGKSCSGK